MVIRPLDQVAVHLCRAGCWSAPARCCASPSGAGATQAPLNVDRAATAFTQRAVAILGCLEHLTTRPHLSPWSLLEEVEADLVGWVILFRRVRQALLCHLAAGLLGRP